MRQMKKVVFFLFMIGLGCKHKAAAPAIHVALVDSNHSIQIIGLDNAIVQEINRDSISGWQTLMPVYHMPADADMKDYQKPQPGKYIVKDSTVIFTPDTPFLKQQTYFVRYYLFEQDNTAIDYLKSDKKLGSAQHRDLIFKQ
jgi:hypothetical protein